MRKLKKILAPLLLALLAVSLTAVVSGHENGDIQRTGEQENEREHEMERRLDIIDTPTAILIRSRVENGTVENHFGLLVTTQHRTEEGFVNGVIIHVAFSHETEVGDVENEAFLHLKIAYFRLTEFNDTNANGAFDAGDNEVKVVDLTQKSYAPLTRANIVSDDGKSGWQITARTTDGLFEVTADIFPQYAVVDSTIVPPTATKITTRVNGQIFQFSNPTSRVALQLMATSRTVIEHETPTTEEKIRVRSATAEGFFTWASTADVDGTPVEVKSSTQRLERPRWIINLAYPQGNSIVHDPVLGFDFGTTPILTSRLLIGAAVAAIAVFGVLVYLGRRQLVRVFTPKPLSQ